MPRFILANDLHMSIRTPVSRLDNYNLAIFSKLDQILILAIKVQAAAILIAGDLFNEKKGTPFYILWQFYCWCKRVREAEIRIVAIPGNHDIQNDRYDSLPLQPLGILFETGIVEDSSFRLLEFSEGVGVTGIPYPAAKSRSNWDTLPHLPGGRNIVMAHCFATPQGGEYFGETALAYSDLLGLPFDVFHFGHDHRDHGVTRYDHDRYMVNVGAISRGSIAQENIVRDVKCVYLEIGADAETRIHQVKLNIAPARDIFDLALKAAKDRERSEIEQFVNQLTADLEDIGPLSFKDRLAGMSLDNTVRERVLYYIEAAEADDQTQTA